MLKVFLLAAAFAVLLPAQTQVLTTSFLVNGGASMAFTYNFPSETLTGTAALDGLPNRIVANLANTRLQFSEPVTIFYSVKGTFSVGRDSAPGVLHLILAAPPFANPNPLFDNVGCNAPTDINRRFNPGDSIPIDFIVACGFDSIPANPPWHEADLVFREVYDSGNAAARELTLRTVFTASQVLQSPDQISFLDDTFSLPLNQPVRIGAATGAVTVKIAYSLNSAPAALVALFFVTSGSSSPVVSSVPVQRGNGVATLTASGVIAGNFGEGIRTALKITELGSELAHDERHYNAVDPSNRDLIEILDPSPDPGLPAPTSPQNISASCVPYARTGATRYLALRIFDPDSPINALLGTSVFQPTAPAQSARLTISGFSVKQADVTLGRIALKCVLYDASQSQVLAESGYFIYALPQSVSGKPTILPNGVTDAARGSSTVSRGGLASIYGSDLAAFITKNDYVPVTTHLGGVQVSIGGRFAPVIFTSPTQLNFQVPFETQVSSAVTVTVTRSGDTSAPVNVAVADYAPQVFVYGAALNPVAVHANGALVTATNPAKPGETIVVFGTGIGKVSSSVAPETGAATSGPAAASDPVTATISGSNARVLYGGLTPGFVGLAQFNVTIPESLPAQPTLPLVIRVGGALSLPVDLPIQ